jgi:sugar phosphate isomerase/epimerase
MVTNLACSTACFHQTSIDVALQEIRLAGFQAIDLNVIPGLCDHFDATQQSGSERQDFITLVRNSRLLVPTVTAALCDFNFPSDNFEFIIQSALVHLKLAAQLACNALNVTCGISAHDRRQFLDQACIQAKGLKPIAQEARCLGLQLNVLAPHSEGPFSYLEDARLLVENIDEQNVRLILDVEQVQSLNISPVDALRGLVGYIGHVRLSNSWANSLGEFFEELNRTGYDGYCTLEMETAQGITEARERLQQVFLLGRSAKPVGVPAHCCSSEIGPSGTLRNKPCGQNR